MIRVRAAAAILVVAVAVLGLDGTATAAPVSLFSSSTPGVASVVVPAGVCFVTVVADGGHGGSSGGVAGVGAQVTARFAVTPGDVLGIHVAGAGANATSNAAGPGGAGGGGGADSNGGGGSSSGGGGASAVWSGTATPMVVAGGGGGSYNGDFGGAAGLLGQPGADGGGSGAGAGGSATGVGGAGSSLGFIFPGAGGGGGVTGGGIGGASFSGVGGAGGVGDGSIGGGGGGAGGGGQPGGAGGAAPGSGAGGASAGPGSSGGAGTPSGGDGGASGSGSTGGGGAGGVGFGGGGGGAPGGGTGGGGGGGYGGGGGGVIGGGGGGSSFVAPSVASSSSVASSRTGDGQVEISSDPTTDACAPAATTTTLTSDHNPSRWGQAVTFTATVTSAAGTPTGSVTFSLVNEDSSTEVLGTGTLTAGVATLTTATLPVQHGQIVADYAATTNFAASTQTLAQTVKRSLSKPFVKATRRISESGDDVVYRVTVASTGEGSGTPTGRVALYRERPNGSRLWIGRGNLSSGETTITVSGLPIGSYPVFAEYRGSATHRPSERRLIQTVNA